jgi:hypothetical protein
MKTLLAAFALCLVVGFGFAQADPAMSAKQKPRIMFTLSAKSAAVHKVSTGWYMLSIPKYAVTKITVFSNIRGKGEVGIKVTDLKRFWTSEAANSFLRNPPNTTLYFAGLGKQAVVIATNFDVNNNLVNIRLKTKKPLPTGAVKSVSIVFDGWGCTADACTQSCNLSDAGCNFCYHFWIAPPALPCAECRDPVSGLKCLCQPGATQCPHKA